VQEQMNKLSNIQPTVRSTTVGRSIEDILEEKANELRVSLPKLFDLELLRSK